MKEHRWGNARNKVQGLGKIKTATLFSVTLLKTLPLAYPLLQVNISWMEYERVSRDYGMKEH